MTDRVRVRPLTYAQICHAHKLYEQGKSLSSVASLYEVSRQRLWGAFDRVGLKCRPLKRQTVSIEIDGMKFTKDKDGYWHRTTSPKIRLNRYLWEKINGPIPEGYLLKFRDGNKDNYFPENMDLIKWSNK